MKQAIIFDMDGVLVDSEVAWNQIEHQHLKKHIPHWGWEHHHLLTGLSQLDSYQMLTERFGMDVSFEDHKAFYKQTAEEIYQNRCELVSGTLELLEELKAAGVPLGLASSSPHYWINMVFARFPIKDFFGPVVSSEDVGGRGKPSPDVYLRAVEELGFQPGDCIAIEDSVNGVRSAKAAGLYTIGFRSGFNTDTDFGEADMVLEGFMEKSRRMVLDLLV